MRMDEQERIVLAELVENNWDEFNRLAESHMSESERADLLKKLQVEDED